MGVLDNKKESILASLNVEKSPGKARENQDFFFVVYCNIKIMSIYICWKYQI